MEIGKTSWNKVRAKVLLYIVYGIITLFFLFPLVWALSLSLKTVPELYSYPPKLLPRTLEGVQNYVYVLTKYGITRNIFNSLWITLCTVTGCLVFTVPAAYAFSRMKFKFSSQLQFSILICQMVSPLVIIIPMYKYFSMLHLLDNYLGLIALYVAISSPFQVWFLKGFIDTIPKELDQAAIIDGCNRPQALIKVLLPVIAPGLFSSVLLISIASWSQFIVPYILITSVDKMPLSVKILNLQTSLSNITTHYLAAASIISILPTLLLFIFLQKYIVSALTAGAVKG
jgi:multiple sugar transport system permease protein